MHDILDDTIDESLTVWTEDYDLARSRALEILVDKCGDRAPHLEVIFT
jgi:hypothetical protein